MERSTQGGEMLGWTSVWIAADGSLDFVQDGTSLTKITHS